MAAVEAEGEIAAARGAGRSGVLTIVPMFAAFSLEEVARQAEGPQWFQLYHVSADLTESLVARAESAGYAAIVLTVDGSAPTIRERDRRNGFDPWATGLLEANLVDAPASLRSLSPREILALPRQATWSDVARLRAATSLPVVLKGITTAEDARVAVEHGVDGIVVSTHGGRLIDSTLSSIESLPEVVEAVGDRVEVFLDSGIRRGSDALKALALGARAVGIGRPLYWGLTVGGADGVHAVLEILRAELDLALAYSGGTDIREVNRAVLNIPPGFGATSPAP